VTAAQHGVLLTCVTQARRLGIWVHDERPRLHLAASPGSRGGKPPEARVHWARPLVPRHPDALEDSIENVLSLVSTCEPYEQALATWESALNKGLVDRERLLRLRWGPRGRRLLAEALPFADAGLETYLRVRLRWLRLPLRFQTWIAGHRVDALIGERLVLQIDGGTHVGAQRDQDNRHDAELKLRGYHVIRLGYHQVMDEWPAVQDLVMRAVAQGLHRARTA
jgi:very-short-patch-repair endonuclease